MLTRTLLVPQLMSASESMRRAIGRDIEVAPSPDAAAAAAFIARAAGPGAVAIVHYGSRAHGSRPCADSGHDFFLIVDRYWPVYRHLCRSSASFSPYLATLLAAWLPPNVISLAVGSRGETLADQAKCVIYSTRHFRQALSPHARDHYAQGRLFQHVTLAWTRDDTARRDLVDGLIDCRLQTLRWVRPHLPPVFDVDDYLGTLLEVSFAGEVRPERPSRLTELLDAQLTLLREPYRAVLAALSEGGLVTPRETGYAVDSPPTQSEWQDNRRYFRRSKRRLLLRLAKHVLLFDGWLRYLTQKIERRTGVEVRLSERERRWPLLFLWPRVIAFACRRRLERDHQ